MMPFKIWGKAEQLILRHEGHEDLPFLIDGIFNLTLFYSLLHSSCFWMHKDYTHQKKISCRTLTQNYTDADNFPTRKSTLNNTKQVLWKLGSSTPSLRRCAWPLQFPNGSFMHISENNEGIAAPTLQSCYLKITTLSKTTCAYILSTALKIVEMASSIAREAKRYCDVMQTEVIISKKNTR